jgi:hypothetical protein
MLSHEMQMKTIANDRFSARLRDAEAYRLAKKNRRSSSLADAIARAAVTVRNAVSILSAVKSPATNDRRVL